LPPSPRAALEHGEKVVFERRRENGVRGLWGACECEGGADEGFNRAGSDLCSKDSAKFGARQVRLRPRLCRAFRRPRPHLVLRRLVRESDPTRLARTIRHWLNLP